MTQAGLYGLIQFFPDIERAEGVNVGVLLCVGGEAVRARVISRVGELRHRLRPSQSQFALSAARSFAVRLASEKILTPEALQLFLSKEAAPLAVTPLRALLVSHVEEEIDRLFFSLVEAEKARGEHKRLDLRILEPLVTEGKVVRDPLVKIPCLPEGLKTPYGFKNGKMNLIKPHIFSSHPTKAIEAAVQIGGKGALLSSYTLDGLRHRLIIVASAPPEVLAGVGPVLEALETRLVPAERIGTLVEEIKTTAHS